MQHKLQNQSGKPSTFVCVTCTKSWVQQPRYADGCPGVIWYGWRSAPAHLKTYSQLRAAHLKPAERRKPDGCIVVKEDFCWLYDERQALPRRRCSPLQVQALEIARQRQREKWTCQHCGYVPSSLSAMRCLFALPGVCKDCKLRIEEDMQRYHDRKSAIDWARAILARTDWAIIDTETTALDGVAIEIAAIAPDGSTLFHSLVKPVAGRSVSAGARAVHRISEVELSQAPELAEIWPELRKALVGRTLLLAYNAKFDSTILSRSARLAKLPELAQDWNCIMEAYAEFCGVWSDYWGSYRWQRLPGAGHRALGDALAALEVLRYMSAANPEDLEDE